MNRRRAVCLLLLWSLASLVWGTPSNQGQTGLRPFSAEYQLRRGSVVFGKVLVSLSISADGDYSYRARTLTAGLAAVLRSDEISEISEGRIERGSVIPQRYQYHHQRAETPRQLKLVFDWQAGRVTNHSASDRWSMPIPAETQDKFSQQLALMLQVGQGARQVEFPVADGGRLKAYRFDSQGEETLETPAGRFATLRLARSKDAKPSQASLWLAPELNYLPLQIERHGDSGSVLLELLSVNWEDG